MPKTKKEDSSDSDSGPEDRNPPSKKSKGSSNTARSTGGDNEEDSWSLGKNRFLKVREFKGKYYVDIREFYDAGGELKPGKKGISLTLEQWHSLKNFMDDVDSCIKRKV